MATVDGLGREPRPAIHLLANHEEGRLGTGSLEQLKYGGGPLGVRPVVEGERHPRLGYRPLDVERYRGAWEDRS